MRALFTMTRRTRGLPAWLRYLLTSGIVLLALSMRWVLFGPGAQFPYLMFFPAVVLAGVLFDSGTSIFAALASALLAIAFFVEPTGTLALASGTDFIGLMVFLGSTVFIGFLIESMHIVMHEARNTADRLAAAHAELAALHAELASRHAERATLLHEASHRFRNDLQRLMTAMDLQLLRVGEGEAKAALGEAQERLAAVSRVTAQLDAAMRPGDGGEVDTAAFIPALVSDIRSTVLGMRPIALQVEAQEARLGLERAGMVGLVLNEMLTNALKHAFPGDRAGRVLVSLVAGPEELVLAVEDDGVGPDGSEGSGGTRLGERLMRSIAARLGGRLEIGPRSGGGTRAALFVPRA